MKSIKYSLHPLYSSFLWNFSTKKLRLGLVGDIWSEGYRILHNGIIQSLIQQSRNL